ncbi:hypothetical protein OH77DRAFT_750648 [Trametes cingulata]|nr:hypothetical protein OH77DRAFT_750648 [Trametes cingulata]
MVSAGRARMAARVPRRRVRLQGARRARRAARSMIRALRRRRCVSLAARSFWPSSASLRRSSCDLPLSSPSRFLAPFLARHFLSMFSCATRFPPLPSRLPTRPVLARITDLSPSPSHPVCLGLLYQHGPPSALCVRSLLPRLASRTMNRTRTDFLPAPEPEPELVS